MKNTFPLQRFIAVVLYTIVMTSCNTKNNNSPEKIEQNTNATIKIGLQTWAGRNLDTETFRNGDNIPEANSDEEWKKAEKDKTPAWCYYDNDPENGKKYGKLYNWYAVNDSRGLAPKGYHVPTAAEWESLVLHLGGNSTAGQKLKSKKGWLENGNGTDESGFFGVPGGARYDFGSFDDVGYTANWWTSTQQEITIGLNGLVWYSNNFVNTDNTNGPNAGLSVRCLKD